MLLVMTASEVYFTYLILPCLICFQHFQIVIQMWLLQPTDKATVVASTSIFKCLGSSSSPASCQCTSWVARDDGSRFQILAIHLRDIGGTLSLCLQPTPVLAIVGHLASELVDGSSLSRSSSSTPIFYKILVFFLLVIFTTITSITHTHTQIQTFLSILWTWF